MEDQQTLLTGTLKVYDSHAAFCYKATFYSHVSHVLFDKWHDHLAKWSTTARFSSPITREGSIHQNMGEHEEIKNDGKM